LMFSRHVTAFEPFAADEKVYQKRGTT